MAKRVKSDCLLLFSFITLVCGAVITGLGVWNGVDIAWTPFAFAIVGLGGLLMGVSFLGMIISRGCTCFCNAGLWVYMITMFLLALGQMVFVVVAGAMKSEWIHDLAKEYADDDESDEARSVDDLKRKYEDFWPFVIGFCVVTLVASVLGLLNAFMLRMRLKAADDELERIISTKPSETDKAERAQKKKRYQDVVVAMTKKYGHSTFNKKGQQKLIP